MSGHLPRPGEVLQKLACAGPTDYASVEDAAHVWGHFVFAKQYAGPKCPRRPSLTVFTQVTDALVRWLAESAFPEKPGAAVLRKYKEIILRRDRWQKDKTRPGNPTDDEMVAVHGEAVGYLGALQDWLKTQRTKRSRRSPTRRDEKREARDKWIYEECCRLEAYDKIVSQLRTIAPNRGWVIVSSKQRVQQIGIEYAKRHQLDLPPPRQNK
jgi:hypothetical protein